MKTGIGSFRTRMFLVTTLIVATVLAGVAALAWSSVRGYETQILDERLCSEARRVALNPPPAFRMDNFQAELVNKLRLSAPDQMLFWFNTTDGAEHFKSHRWPDAFNIDALAWKDTGPAGRESTPPPPEEGPPEAPGGGPPEGRGPGDDRPPRPLAGRPPPRLECRLASFRLGDADWHAGMIATPRSRGFVAANLGAARAELQGALKGALGIALPCGLLLIAVGAWFLSGMALRPVIRLRDAMRQVDRNALDQRLPDAREDGEFRELIVSYNDMLERLEASFNQASRFSADAAHELKTPLTILQGQIERAIRLADNRAIQVNLSEMLDEVGRLASISRKLLLLSQADAGKLAVMKKRVDLSRMLNDSLADAQMLGLKLRFASDIDDLLVVDGDEQLLMQLLNNIVGNAAKYTPEGGEVSIRARAVAGGVEAVFRNSAPQVTAEHRRHFFDRFYRGDAAHNRSIDGHGLGLSLSRVIARAHGGELALLPADGPNVALRLSLPAAA